MPSPAASDLCVQAQQVFSEELQILIKEPVLQVDELWALKKMQQGSTEISGLEKFITERAKTLPWNTPFLRLLRSDLPLQKLPKDPGKGIQRLYTYLQAPFGLPVQRALAYMQDFVQTPATGYVLAHQFLVLVWGEEQGRSLHEEMTEAKGTIIAAMLEEQRKEGEFSDLYAERAAFLLYFSKVEPADGRKWVTTLLKARKPDGGWGEYVARQSFDGQSGTIKPSENHTRVLSLMALQAFLSQQCQTP